MINLREAAGRRELEQRAALRLAKLEEIKKLWEDLFFIVAGEAVFQKCPEFHNYAGFEKSLRRALQEVRGHEGQPDSKPTGNQVNSQPEVLAPGGTLTRLDYLPPQHGTELAADVLGLWEYYCSGDIPPSLEMILDLSLCKIIRAVSRLCILAWKRGEATLSPVKAHKEKVLSRKTDVFEAYYLINNKKIKGMNLSRLANSIIDKFLTGEKKAPSKRTIIRYLQSDERIRQELIEIGVIKDKTGSVKKNGEGWKSDK